MFSSHEKGADVLIFYTSEIRMLIMLIYFGKTKHLVSSHGEGADVLVFY